ncbi:hypothetical protein OPT61_g1216 [Boeremia exigua]|uniref:Uncharacterized protein n=1 Tax=Boeremia exigua TaxID=749465 RepID=A0ACC2IR50_9PLEO|nr:hypothetical protein OPT61_g1216 [Boeremia exigua]
MTTSQKFLSDSLNLRAYSRSATSPGAPLRLIKRRRGGLCPSPSAPECHSDPLLAFPNRYVTVQAQLMICATPANPVLAPGHAAGPPYYRAGNTKAPNLDTSQTAFRSSDCALTTGSGLRRSAASESTGLSPNGAHENSTWRTDEAQGRSDVPKWTRRRIDPVPSCFETFRGRCAVLLTRL